METIGMIDRKRHNGEDRNLLGAWKTIPAFAGMMLLLCLPAFAADKPTQPAGDAPTVAVAEEKPEQAAGYYGPDFCDFEITFPEKPYKAQKCVPGTTRCYDLYSYTMVYDLQTTVDISAICNPSTPVEFDKYSKGVMKAALEGMVNERGLENYAIEHREQDKVHSASLTGTGKTGTQDKIYTAQIWAGQHSVFTVQAELIGRELEQADKTFSEILKSIKVKEGKQLPGKTAPKDKTNK